jgi:hypothetical protein
MIKPLPKNIKPTDFYETEEEKIKLNWFCYEYALELQLVLDNKLKNKFKKNKISQETVNNFCIQHSKFMRKQILLKLSGKIPQVGMNYTDIEKYFSQIGDKLIDDILLASGEAWDSQTEGCCICPTRCISEKDSYAPMFDDHYGNE